MKTKNMIVAIVAVLLAIILSTVLIFPKVIDFMKAKEQYYESEKYEVQNPEDVYLKKEHYRLIKSYEDYEGYLEGHEIELRDNDLEDIEDKDYNNFNYIIVFIPTNSCGEEIKYDKTLLYEEEKEIKIKFKAQEACGLCAYEYILYEIAVPKTIDYSYMINIEWDREETYCNSNVAYKPILYIYPEQKTNIKVDFAKEENLTTTYPKFNKEWNVVAHPNGDLYDSNNNYYYALYWEEKEYSKVDFTEGFYVTKDNAISFLEEKLSILGLNSKERNEFIMYWLPILEKNEHNLVYFELTNELQNQNELIITPQPDTLIRIRMHVKKVDKETTIKEQILTKQKRIGYTAIEWGGVIHN